MEAEKVLNDCLSLTHNKEICDDHVSQYKETDTTISLVKDEEEFKPALQVKPLDVDNPAYLTARAAALQLPGAVILHSILR